MQRRAPAPFGILDHTVGEAGVLRKEPVQPLDVALIDDHR
jgi:hypothetical protein